MGALQVPDLAVEAKLPKNESNKDNYSNNTWNIFTGLKLLNAPLISLLLKLDRVCVCILICWYLMIFIFVVGFI